MRGPEDVVLGKLDAVALTDSVLHLTGGGPGLVRDLGRERGVGVDLELVEPRPGGLADNGDLRLAARQGAAHHIRLAIGTHAGCDADDLGLLRGKAKQLGAAASDDERRVGTLDRPR